MLKNLCVLVSPKVRHSDGESGRGLRRHLWGPSVAQTCLLFTPRGLCRKVWQGGTKYRWQRSLPEAQSIRVVGGEGPPESNALWKFVRMPRGTLLSDLTLQGPQSIRVVGGKGPRKSNALWKSFKMSRGDPLITLDPKMLIQFWCFCCF